MGGWVVKWEGSLVCFIFNKNFRTEPDHYEIKTRPGLDQYRTGIGPGHDQDKTRKGPE